MNTYNIAVELSDFMFPSIDLYNQSFVLPMLKFFIHVKEFKVHERNGMFVCNCKSVLVSLLLVIYQIY